MGSCWAEARVAAKARTQATATIQVRMCFMSVLARRRGGNLQRDAVAVKASVNARGGTSLTIGTKISTL